MTTPEGDDTNDRADRAEAPAGTAGERIPVASWAAGEPEGAPASRAHALTYSTLASDQWVVAGRYGAHTTAEMHAALLRSEQIPARVEGANVNALGMHFSGFTDVKVMVLENDAERAAAALARLDLDQMEPAEDAAALDDSGEPLPIVTVAAFESARGMSEAETLMVSVGIRAYPTPLVPRGNRPPGEGKRFILRAHEDDAERARSILEESEEEAREQNEPRCPKCRSWRVYPVSQLFRGVAAVFGLAPKPEPLTDCLACHYRGPTTEFLPAGGASSPISAQKGTIHKEPS